jgi:ferredoxin
MKRKFKIIALFASLMMVTYSSYSMIMASIDVPTCYNCGSCWEIAKEPFFEHPEGGAGWGEYESLYQWDMRFYAYPTSEHQLQIEKGIFVCPSTCINVS